MIFKRQYLVTQSGSYMRLWRCRSPSFKWARNDGVLKDFEEARTYTDLTKCSLVRKIRVWFCRDMFVVFSCCINVAIIPKIVRITSLVQSNVYLVIHITAPHQWLSYQICKIAGCARAGMPWTFSPPSTSQRKPLVTDLGMCQGMPWYMSGSPTRGDEENIPGIPGTCGTRIWRIW